MKKRGLGKCGLEVSTIGLGILATKLPPRVLKAVEDQDRIFNDIAIPDYFALYNSAKRASYKVMLGGALNVGVTPIEVKEIVYQSVSYVGIAKALDFIHATNEILESRGINLPLEGQSTTTPERKLSFVFVETLAA